MGGGVGGLVLGRRLGTIRYGVWGYGGGRTVGWRESVDGLGKVRRGDVLGGRGRV